MSFNDSRNIRFNNILLASCLPINIIDNKYKIEIKHNKYKIETKHNKKL
jgi:hypothetical protein